MNDRVKPGRTLYIDMCVPDMEKETCTIDPTDTFSQIKYAIPKAQTEYINFVMNGNTGCNPDSFGRILNNLRLDEDNSVDNMLLNKSKSIIIGNNKYTSVHASELVAGNAVSPFFSYSYNLSLKQQSIITECGNEFCKFSNGSDCNQLTSSRGYVYNFYNAQPDLWNYYLDAVIYKLVNDTGLINGDTTLGTQKIENYNSNSASNPKNAIDYYIDFWSALDNQGREDAGSYLTGMLEKKLSDNFEFDLNTNTFKKKSANARKNLDYNIMEDVYCEDSKMKDDYKCKIVRNYSSLSLEGKPRFNCIKGTTTKGANGKVDKNCRALMLDTEKYLISRHSLSRYDGICKFICDDGQYTNDETYGCQLCPAGTYSKKGAFECTECPNGTYSNFEGSSKCTPCDSGLLSNDDKTACTKCPAGTYANDGICSPCPKGTYSVSDEATGSMVCKRCTLGKTTATEGSTSEDQCTVDAEYTFKIANKDYSFKFPDFLKAVVKKK